MERSGAAMSGTRRKEAKGTGTADGRGGVTDPLGLSFVLATLGRVKLRPWGLIRPMNLKKLY